MSLHHTSLHDWHRQHQARIVPFAGWEMPVQYKSVIEEHRAVRSGAGLFDVSHMARISFAGADALPLLEKVCTNAVGSMKNLQVRYSLICNESGGTLDDVLVYRWPYGFAMVANASNREKIINWLKEHGRNRSVDIVDQTESTAMIAVQGPKAVDCVRGLFTDDVTRLKNYFAQPSRYRDKNCVVSRTGYTGEDGFEIMLPGGLANEIWEELIAKGASPCGLGARDTLRLEAGMPLYGHELNERIDPLQAGLGWAVKFEKDFIGKLAIQARSQQPSESRSVRIGLQLEGKRAAREGSTIIAGEKGSVGTVTSGSYVPWLEKSIAMGYVHANIALEGLSIDVKGSLIPAEVVPLPFYNRVKKA